MVYHKYNRLKILLIEDNRGDQLLIGKMLTDSGLISPPDAVSYLDDGLKLLQSKKYDVILLDLSLPDAEGVNTFDRLTSKYPELAIIILTGSDDESVWMEALSHGAQDYLVKGKFDRELLTRTIYYSFERKEFQTNLQKSIEEKDYLMREIHHRVKNNLQIISSIISVQANQEKDDSCRNALTDIQNRVFAIAHLHEKLQEAENHTIIDIKEYISGLAVELSQTYQLDQKKINIVFQMGNVLIDAKTAVACGLIMNEILTNAVKYAFPGGRPGNIFISFKQAGDKYSYSIRDDGVGLPEDYGQAKTGSLGLLLIRALVGSSSGSLEIVNGPGAEFKIILPVISDTMISDNGEGNGR